VDLGADYARHDGLGLAELVRRGEVAPDELLDEALRRLERVDPTLNAVVHRMEPRARARAADPGDGPFAGVPFLLKDLLATVAGEPMRSGSRLYRGYRPPVDSEVVRRLERAGFLIFGKTSTPELGILPVTEPALFGPTRNPWDPDRTPGGSSGGSAAAVAAGVVPLASGGDGGGSIRIPASCCGLFGLKPGRGRVPTGPVEVEYWAGCVSEGVLTRSVRDGAAALDVLAGPDPGAPYHAPPPPDSFLAEAGRPPGRLRVAFTTRPPVAAKVHPDCAAAAADAARLLEELGHDVREAAPPFDGDAFARDFVVLLIGETAADVRDAEAATGRRARPGDLEPETAALALLAREVTAEDYAIALRRLKRTCRVAGRFFQDTDVLLTPTLARPPVPVGSLRPRGPEAVLLKALLRLRAGGVLKAMGALEKLATTAWSFSPFTPVWNVTGQPAMSVPLTWSAAGLPIGAHFVARQGEEGLLLRLAAQLEEARPWRDRRPRVHSDAPRPASRA